MPRGKAATSKTSTRGSKKVKETVKEEDDVIELGSDEESKVNEDDNDGLPAAPASVKSVKKVLVLPTEIRQNGLEKIQEFLLPHPRTGNKSLFLIYCGDDDDKKQLAYEVLTMHQDTRSWFVDNSVISDGNMYVTTPVDPLFLILPLLAKADKLKPIRDHLEENGLSRNVVELFAKSLSQKQLQNVSEVKDLGDLVVYRYSEENTLAWLIKKVDKVSDFLIVKGISHAKASISSNFVSKVVPTTVSKEESIRFACEIVSEYLEASLKKKLYEKLGIPLTQEKTGLKRKNDENLEDESNKKSKISDTPVKPLEDYGSEISSPATKVKTTAKDKVFQKAAQGTHSLLKFFSAKSK